MTLFNIDYMNDFRQIPILQLLHILFYFFIFFLDKERIQSSPLGPFYAVFSLTCFKLKIKLFPD